MRAVVIITCALCLTSASALFTNPNLPPVVLERVIINMEAYLAEHPDDADAKYTLARAYTLSFVTYSGVESMCFVPDEFLEQAAEQPRQSDYASTADEPPIERLSSALMLLHEAEQEYIQSRDFQADLARAELTDAYARWIGAPRAVELLRSDPMFDAKPMKIAPRHLRLMEWARLAAWRDRVSAELAELSVSELLAIARTCSDSDHAMLELVKQRCTIIWLKEAFDKYHSAWFFSKDADLQRIDEMNSRHAAFHTDLVAREAVEGMRTVAASIRVGATEADESRLQHIDKKLAEAEKWYKSMERAVNKKPRPKHVTPIIFPLDEDRSLGSLLAPSTTVNFDLDGTGRDHSWPWVNPNTAILVWDPDNTGKITSGRQLFGSATWWLMFADGYRALDALDDNRDGQLAGEELDGIAVWIDANSNGVSDPGEVNPVVHHGINALSTRATTTADGCPANHAGVHFADARSLPTYDWIAASVENKP